MITPSVVIPVAVGVVIAISAFAEVPREDRAVQWPVLAGVTVFTLVVGVWLLRRGGVPLPPARKVIPETGAVVIPLRPARAA